MPHVGNYFGAIKPAIERIADGEGGGFLFIADYHALTTVKDAELLRQYVKEIACTWLACGLDAGKTIFYRQSDVPEIFELATILSNSTPKGLLNRAHAYKAAVQMSLDAGKDPDNDVNMGLFNYPVLMAADILAFGTNFVPVGSDQKQHCEIASDIAKAFNHVYGQVLTIPEALILKEQAVLPGLDGRKMSKSYGNQIPLFVPEKQLEKYIKRIVTDSSDPNQPKTTHVPIFQLYKLFASEQETKVMEEKFAKGISWGEVKGELFTVANRQLASLREKYNYYMENYTEVEKILAKGALRAREVATKTLARVRKAIGAG